MTVLILVYYATVQETGESAEYRSFRDHFGDLFESIQNPTTLSARLFTAGLLSRETRKRICSRTLVDTEKVSVLLDATETTIRLDPSNYHKFMEALEKDSSMQHLCGKLRSTCGEWDNVCLSISRQFRMLHHRPRILMHGC